MHILTPKLRSNFKLSFSNEKLKVLEDQTLAFDFGTENLQKDKFIHQTMCSVIWLQEDELSTVHRAVRNFVNNEEQTDLIVNIFGLGNNILEKLLIKDVSFIALQHSILNYQPQTKNVNLEFKIPGTTSTTTKYISDLTGLKETPDDKLNITKTYNDSNIGTVKGTISPESENRTSVKLLQIKFEKFEYLFLDTIH